MQISGRGTNKIKSLTPALPYPLTGLLIPTQLVAVFLLHKYTPVMQPKFTA